MNYRYAYNVYTVEYPQGRSFETKMDANRYAAQHQEARVTISRTDRNLTTTEMLISVYESLGGFGV